MKNFIINELKTVYRVDLCRIKTKLFLFIFNILPDLYILRVFKNLLLYVAGMDIYIFSCYIKNGIYCDDASSISIGKGVFINKNVYFEGEGKIIIGEGVQIAPNVQFLTTNHIEKSDVIGNIVVGNNVWIGAGSIVLPNTSIKDNITIAGGSIVRGILDEGKLFGGIIATKKR